MIHYWIILSMLVKFDIASSAASTGAISRKSPTPDLYPPATDDPLSFFPCLPNCHGDASYEADKKLHTLQLSESLIWSPNTLSGHIHDIL